MALPWQTLETVNSPDGPLELRQRGGDFLILVRGRVLMNSHHDRSERALAEVACQRIAERSAPNVLVGGLGMGCTLRTALDALPADARVDVMELNEDVARWCAGPLSEINAHATQDPRVQIRFGDVADRIARTAEHTTKTHPRYDAIVLDLYEGPHAKTEPRRDPFYGRQALDRTFRALRPGGLFAVWSEAQDAKFEKRLAGAGFRFERTRPGRGGLRHAVYLATRPG